MMKSLQLLSLLCLVAISYGCTIQLAPLPASSTVGTTASANSGDTTDILRGTGSWNAGWWNAPIKYITYSFAQTVELSSIVLVVDQSPSGTSTHELIDSNNNVLHTFNGFTAKGDVLTYTFPSGTFSTSLTIRTTFSNSNTAWLSITINSVCPACNVQLAPITPTGLVQTGITTNSGDPTDLLYGTGSWNGGWWNAPDKYVQYNFDTIYELVSIRLVVDQQPSGPTSHQIIGSSGVLHTFSGFTERGTVLFFQFPAGTSTNTLQVLTISSNSNAAWLNITIVANKPICPTQVAPIPSWSSVPTTITTNSGDAVPLLRGTGSWNGGWWVPLKFVTYNFGSIIELDSIVLVVDQAPAGNTQHQLSNSAGTVLHTFSGHTQRGTVLSYKFPAGTLTSALTIRTTSSVSNAAWLSVTILRK